MKKDRVKTSANSKKHAYKIKQKLKAEGHKKVHYNNNNGNWEVTSTPPSDDNWNVTQEYDGRDDPHTYGYPDEYWN